MLLLLVYLIILFLGCCVGGLLNGLMYGDYGWYGFWVRGFVIGFIVECGLLKFL